MSFSEPLLPPWLSTSSWVVWVIPCHSCFSFHYKKSLARVCVSLNWRGPWEVKKDVRWEVTAQNAAPPSQWHSFLDPSTLCSLVGFPRRSNDCSFCLQSISAIFSWALVLAFMEVLVAGGGRGGWPGEKGRWASSLGCFQIIFPKGNSALPKTNFGASHRLIFCQPHYDDFNSITGILERIATHAYIMLHSQPWSRYTEVAGWGKEESWECSLVGKMCTPKVFLLKQIIQRKEKSNQFRWAHNHNEISHYFFFSPPLPPVLQRQPLLAVSALSSSAGYNHNFPVWEGWLSSEHEGGPCKLEDLTWNVWAGSQVRAT